MLKKLRKSKPFPFTKEELLLMPEGSLGNDLARFIDTRKLQLLPHYARHDMKHIVLGFDTTEEDEFCLQSFMLGNGRVSVPVLLTVGFGFFTAPEYWKKMKASFQLGKQCSPIHEWNWFELVPMQTMEIRNRIYQSKQ